MNLLLGFQKHGQDQAAGRIQDLMLARGIFPAHKSWRKITSFFPDSNVALQAEQQLNRQLLTSRLDGGGQQLTPEFSGPSHTLEAKSWREEKADEGRTAMNVGALSDWGQQQVD